jgi:hypothetical protein
MLIAMAGTHERLQSELDADRRLQGHLVRRYMQLGWSHSVSFPIGPRGALQTAGRCLSTRFESGRGGVPEAYARAVCAVEAF